MIITQGVIFREYSVIHGNYSLFSMYRRIRSMGGDSHRVELYNSFA